MLNAFSKDNPQIRRVWDSTTLRALYTDPASYKLRYVDGWREIDPSPPLVFGAIYHAALEEYDKALAMGEGREVALTRAICFAIVHCQKPGPFLGRPDWTETMDEIAANYGNPKQKNNRTVETMVRTLIWYDAEYGDDTMCQVLMVGGKPAVELSFRLPLPIKTPAGENYILAGHLDGLVDVMGMPMVRERKHTVTTVSGYYFDRYKPDVQIDTYALLGSAILGRPVAGVIVEASQVGVKFSRFMRKEIRRGKGCQEEFLKHICWKIKEAERMALEDTWPINSVGLGLYGGKSGFRSVMFRDPSHRAKFMPEFYELRPDEMWNPLEER